MRGPPVVLAIRSSTHCPRLKSRVTVLDSDETRTSKCPHAVAGFCALFPRTKKGWSTCAPHANNHSWAEITFPNGGRGSWIGCWFSFRQTRRTPSWSRRAADLESAVANVASKQASRCRNSQKQKSHFRSEARTVSVWRSAKKPRVEESAACCYHMAQGYGEPKVRSSRPGGRRCSEWPGVFRKPRGPCAPRRRRWPFVTTTAPSRRPSSLFLVSRRQGPYNFLDLLSICLYFT